MLNNENKKNIKYEKINETEGSFIVYPLNPGFGVTYGNLYRRVLLSSIGGYAICGVKIKGVNHMYSSIDGVVEDVMNIILNLKEVKLKRNNNLEEKKGDFVISIVLSKTTKFLAKDIEKYTNDFTVLNSEDFVICNLIPSVTLEIDLKIRYGYGYFKTSDLIDHDLLKEGFLAIDSFFTPVVNVSFNIENIRVEDRIDYDKLSLCIKTNGTKSHIDAFKDASKIVFDDLNFFSSSLDFENIQNSDENKNTNDPYEDHIKEKDRNMNKELKDCKNLGLPTRAINLLKEAGFNTVNDLIIKDIELISKKMGAKTYAKTIEFINKAKNKKI